MEKTPEELGNLWRPLSRTRTGLSLVLGVIAGIALLSLPALVSPAYQGSNTDTVVSPQSMDARNTLSAEPSIGSFTTSPPSEKLVLAFKLFLILIPGSMLSILARRWASRRLKDYLYY